MPIKLHKIKSYYELKNSENLSNLELGRLRKLTILDWIYRFRYSTLPVLKELFPDVAPARIQELIKRMEKRKEIRKFPLLTAFTRVGYCLTDTGFNYLQVNYPYRQFGRVFKETGSLSASNFVHDLAIQTIIAESMRDDVSETGFANEWEVRGYFENQKGKLPDAIFEKTVNDKVLRLALEVELSPKSQSRLHSSIQSAFEKVSSSEADAIYYLTPTPALENTIKKAVKELGINNRAFINTSETLKKLILGGR